MQWAYMYAHAMHVFFPMAGQQLPHVHGNSVDYRCYTAAVPHAVNLGPEPHLEDLAPVGGPSFGRTRVPQYRLNLVLVLNLRIHGAVALYSSQMLPGCLVPRVDGETLRSFCTVSSISALPSCSESLTCVPVGAELS